MSGHQGEHLSEGAGVTVGHTSLELAGWKGWALAAWEPGLQEQSGVTSLASRVGWAVAPAAFAARMLIISPVLDNYICISVIIWAALDPHLQCTSGSTDCQTKGLITTVYSVEWISPQPDQTGKQTKHWLHNVLHAVPYGLWMTWAIFFSDRTVSAVFLPDRTVWQSWMYEVLCVL